MATIVQQTNGEKTIYTADEYTNVLQKFSDVNSQLADITKNIIYFVDKSIGGVGDGLTDNTQALINLATQVNSLKGNCVIIIPPGTYNYTPNLTGSNWRSSVEMVDVSNVVILAKGAVLQQKKQTGWTANGDASGNHNEEGPIQFRSTGQGTCKNISIYGLDTEGDRVPYSSSTGDGACFGLAFRGVYNIKLVNVKANGWGTDGLYLGTTYGNTYKSFNAKAINCEFDNNTRQGASVAGCDDFFFSNTTFSNTNGGSFGHGLDMEANSPVTQTGGLITNCKFLNNQRGSLNFINTSNVEVGNCILDEQNTGTNGAIYGDSGNGIDSISIHDCTVITKYAVLYIGGSKVTNFFFKNNKVKTTDLPSNWATIRINPSNNQTGLDNIVVKDNEFEGTGGIYGYFDGTLYFRNNKMKVSKQNSSSADVFNISLNGTTYFQDNKIVIGSDVVCSARDVYITAGYFDRNELISQANAIYSIQDRGAGRTVVIGHNKFSTYFFYQGEVSNLNVKVEGTIVENLVGEYGNAVRVVHGGRFRVQSGTNALLGDVTRNSANLIGGGTITTEWVCTAAGSPGTWMATKWITKKGTSPARPTTLGSYDAGVMYLDTTLAANGKPIWWTGSGWVDSTGATV